MNPTLTSLALRCAPFALGGILLIATNFAPKFGAFMIGMSLLPFLFIYAITAELPREPRDNTAN